jgi:hypothetical protein
MTYRALAIVALIACAGDGMRAERARTARYDADRSELVRRTAEEVRQHYPTLAIGADGTIKTAWHQVGGSGLEREPGLRGTSGEKWFIRFDVTISPDRPAAIEVSPYTARWETGMAVPVELGGADQPTWVQPRADRLRIQIHDALQPYAQ